jgi:uncharacterized protein (DUF1330 family)
MAAWLVSTVCITDPGQFALYAKAIAGLAEDHGGRYVVRGPVTEQLEGDGPADERVVVLEFPDAASARAYVDSGRYQAGKALRLGAADVRLRLIVG